MHPGRRGPRLATFALLIYANSAAETMPPRSIEDLVRNSGTIVEGRVVSKRAAWNPTRTQIRTEVHLAVIAMHRGIPPGPNLRFQMLGGAVGETTMSVLGQPQLRVGDDLLLLLGPAATAGDFPFVGGDQGVFRIEADPSTGEPLLRGRSGVFRRRDFVRGIARVGAGQRFHD